MTSAQPDEVVELIYHEFCLAESNGLAPDPGDFLRRFPDREASLDRLFRLHGALSSTELREWTTPVSLPEVGDEIGPYILRRELGQGSFARVYLAEQTNLDDRLVVVKISGRLTPEPRLLAAPGTRISSRSSGTGPPRTAGSNSSAFPSWAGRPWRPSWRNDEASAGA